MLIFFWLVHFPSLCDVEVKGVLKRVFFDNVLHIKKTFSWYQKEKHVFSLHNNYQEPNIVRESKCSRMHISVYLSFLQPADFHFLSIFVENNLIWFFKHFDSSLGICSRWNKSRRNWYSRLFFSRFGTEHHILK